MLFTMMSSKLILFITTMSLIVCHASHHSNRTLTSEANVSLPKFKTWGDLIQIEQQCVNKQFITVECFLSVAQQNCNLFSRWERTCPLDPQNIQFDVTSRRDLPKYFAVTVIELLTHPRLRVNRLKKSIKFQLRLATIIERLIHHLLTEVEEDIITLVYSNFKYPKQFNYRIPALFGDFGLFTPVRPEKIQLFYMMVRFAVHSFKSKYGFEFYTTPNYSKHISDHQFASGAYLKMFPELMAHADRMFGPSNYRLYFDRGPPSPLVVFSKDMTSLTIEVDQLYYSANPQIELHDFSRYPGLSTGGEPRPFLSAPFLNLGYHRARAILNKVYCERHKDEKGVCYHPCHKKGWISSCHGGSLRRPEENDNDWNVCRFDLYDAFRPCFECNKERPEMKLSRPRRLCENILNYNISERFPPTRAKISDCSLIIGTGNHAQCRSAVRQYLIKAELLFRTDDEHAHFGTANSVRRILRRLKLPRIVVSGAFMFTPSQGVLNDEIMSLSIFNKLSRSYCNTPLHESNSPFDDVKCFLSVYLVELLKAFGADYSTEVVFSIGWFLPGNVDLGVENDPSYIKDFFSIGPDHWKTFKFNNLLKEI